MIRLSPDELRFFVRYGYVIKRGVLNPALMERARARLWEGAPPGRSRGDPGSWMGPFREEEESSDGDNIRRDFRWLYREPGREPWMVRLIATDPDILAMAEQLIGRGQVQPPTVTRGIYCTLPFGTHRPYPVECHSERHSFHLGIVGYIADVPPNGGGFAVWPGSHRHFHPCYHSRHLDDRTEAYPRVSDQVNRGTVPVTTFGSAGDVIFWHHRLGHNVSTNWSSQIRQSVMCEFAKVDLEQTAGLPTSDDMWCDWSEELRSLATQLGQGGCAVRSQHDP